MNISWFLTHLPSEGHLFSFLAVLHLRCSTWGPCYTMGDLSLQCMGPWVVVHRLSSCGIQTPQHAGWVAVVGVLGFSGCMVCWILVPWPGIEPVSLALLGGFLTRWTNQGSLRTSWLVPSFGSYEYLLLLSSSVMSNCLQPHGLQHTRPPCPSPSPRVYSNSCPSSQWCHPTISSLLSPSPAFNLSQHQGLFQSVSSSHQVAKVFELQLQHQSFQWIFRVDFL